nr:immunoglobulin light chain junction region [Macaca mulatta]MPO04995.1 immunoglobulin light chain junction region [Macaca mulatta]MPO05419.1 immunoglobulin light chain junction region [Macaca mulatta]MPO05925.1 immunoglobulin light chain junction region [Macaca mulatta]MPO08129.1 immunoglobulin light chain junction region [Macaca mulatta]
CNSYAGSNVLF